MRSLDTEKLGWELRARGQQAAFAKMPATLVGLIRVAVTPLGSRQVLLDQPPGLVLRRTSPLKIRVGDRIRRERRADER